MTKAGGDVLGSRDCGADANDKIDDGNSGLEKKLKNSEKLNKNVLDIKKLMERSVNEPEQNPGVIEAITNELKTKREEVRGLRRQWRPQSREKKKELMFDLLIDFISLSKKAELSGNPRIKSRINKEIYKMYKLPGFHRFRRQCEDYLKKRVLEILEKRFEDFNGLCYESCREYTEFHKIKLFEEILREQGIPVSISYNSIGLKNWLIGVLMKYPQIKTNQNSINQAEKTILGLI